MKPVELGDKGNLKKKGQDISEQKRGGEITFPGEAEAE